MKGAIMKTYTEIKEELARTRPNIAIKTTWEEDPYFSWDGDGPDPRDEGFSPYNVTVTAMTIKNGKILEGISCLGGCYNKYGEPFDPDIYGYGTQMIEESLSELDELVKRIGRSI